MRLIGNLNGIGNLIINGDDRGQIGYKIEVHETSGGTRQGIGKIEATQEDLFDAYTSNDVHIRLKDGSTVSIVVANASFSGAATFKTNGPVPGF